MIRRLPGTVAGTVAMAAGILATVASLSAADAPSAVLSFDTNGSIRLTCGEVRLAQITPGLFDAAWNGGTYVGANPKDIAPGRYRGKLKARAGEVATEVRSTGIANGVSLAYTLTPKSALRLQILHVSLQFPESELAGQAYEYDGTPGTVPAKDRGTSVFTKRIRRLSLNTRTAGRIVLEFPKPTNVLLQDDRRWEPSFSVRIGESLDAKKPTEPGVPTKIDFSIVRPDGLAVEYDAPVTLAAGPDWVPLDYEPEIEPGSALDFSNQGQLDAPAGKYGRVVARPDGTFAFEKSPEKPRRFYGVNFCGTSQYLEHDQAERLADRVARIGYNAVRIHHYESGLIRGGTETVTLDPKRLDQLDYLLAAFKKRGIYITTDLFVSRPVKAAEIWADGQGKVEMHDFKLAVMINEKAYANWQAFARNLLSHRNPYTGLTYAEDPALAWLSMVNEGNIGNFLGGIKSPQLKTECQHKWNAFLAQRYGSAAALRKAWGRDPGGDPEAGTVPLVPMPWKPDESPAVRDSAAFCASVDLAGIRRMKAFLRDELHCPALVTNMNAWMNPLANQAVRAEFDYVDDHFYIDHPHFLDRPWSLPSSCPNTSPIVAGAPGGCSNCFVRLIDRPMAITEYNYSGPGRFRGVGGILTGCLGALQDFGGIWRFAFSHTRDNLFQASTAGYFDVGVDPLNQLAERAALCLYLRGDMRPAPHQVTIALNPSDLLTQKTSARSITPPWSLLAHLTKVGTSLAGDQPIRADLVLPVGAPAIKTSGQVLDQDPYADDAGPKILDAMRARGWLDGNLTDLDAKRFQSETRELLIDATRDVMVLDTARTAGGYGPEGETIRTSAATISLDKSFATVWVSSLDAQPIAQSKRLLLCHLTDLQNTGALFGEKARRTLYSWGQLPHLVQAGEATVQIRLAHPNSAVVYAISPSGKRMEKVPATVQGDSLVVTLRITGPDGRARLAYEITAE